MAELVYVVARLRSVSRKGWGSSLPTPTEVVNSLVSVHMKNFLKQIIIFKLTVLSRLYLMHYKPYIIAITGNIGKTSAKDMIYAAVHTAKITRASQKSFNNEFGIPLTILGEKTGDSSMLEWVLVLMRASMKVIYDPYAPEVLILEVGVDAPGDMDRAMRGITVDIGIITAIPEFPVHAVNFSSACGVLEEKSKLFDSLKHGGRITDADSFFTRSLAHADSSMRSVGYAQHADIHLVSADIAYVDGEVQLVLHILLRGRVIANLST